VGFGYVTIEALPSVSRPDPETENYRAEALPSVSRPDPFCT
jgi:hypothetical protein